MTLSFLGDSAVAIELGEDLDDATIERVHSLAAGLRADPPPGVVDVVAAFASVTVFFDLGQIGDYQRLYEGLKERVGRVRAGAGIKASRVVEIPVCYGGEFGPDLADVAARAQLSETDAVALHAGASYRVLAVGFVPGFAYLAGLPRELHAPRRATPRTAVPAGSVGIGGDQTAVYPLRTPGGWNLIGRTPLALFRSAESPPALLAAGDQVRFKPISETEFAQWK
jgi:inhibitor of KinA